MLKWTRTVAGNGFRLLPALVLFVLLPQSVGAHTSEGGFVLLLPTGFYIVAGTMAVVMSLVIISVLPVRYAHDLFDKTLTLFKLQPRWMTGVSFASFVIFFGLIVMGWFGPRDPLENILPLVIWTLWWQGLVILHALFGNWWHWLNPWRGVYEVVVGPLEQQGYFLLPEKIGITPAIIGYLGFGIFELVDIAPDDPARLAIVAGFYWLYTFVGMVLFGGRVWLERGECFSVLFRYFSRISPFGIVEGNLRLGFPGWRLVQHNAVSISGGVFASMVLAIGSFDGLNETFWWLGKLGINPLEFPGRSSVVVPNLLGLVSADILLAVVVFTCLAIGFRLAGAKTGLAGLAKFYSRMALTLIPIAVGYHFSHFLTAFLVNVQYVIVAISNPFDMGSDFLGLGKYFVSSGFLNSRDSVQFIWLWQAGVVVLGHVLGVLSAHAIALRHCKTSDKALYSELVFAVFMISYTIFGLWLLATPRGA